MWLSQQPIGRSRSAQRRISRAPGGQDCASNCGATSRCGCLSCSRSRSRGRESGTATAAAAAAETETGPCPARRRSGAGAADTERALSGKKSQNPNPKLQGNFNQQISKYPLRAYSFWRLKFSFPWGLELGIWILGQNGLSEFPAALFRTDCGQQNDSEKNETFHQRHGQGVIGISIRVSKMVGQPGLLLRGIGSREISQLICQSGKCSTKLTR